MDSLVFNLDFIMVFFFLLSLVFLLFVTLALLIGGVLGVQVDLNLIVKNGLGTRQLPDISTPYDTSFGIGAHHLCD